MSVCKQSVQNVQSAQSRGRTDVLKANRRWGQGGESMNDE